MSRKCLVSFVVLNWNGLDDTLECLKSIRNQSMRDYEIIVVDNGSEEKQKQALRNIEDIRLVDLPHNTGFTGGQLAAYKVSSGKFIALINNDAVLAKNWAEKAVGILNRDSKAAVVGGRAYEWDESKGQKPFRPTNDFYSYQAVDLVTGHTKTLRYGDQAGPVNSVSGSAVMIRRSAAEKTGYFYKRFFAYYEETDLFARFKRAGWKIMYSPDLAVWHKIAQSSNRASSSFYLYFMHRNRFIFALRNYDQPYLGRFIKFYLKETASAGLRLARRGRANAIEEYNMIRAFGWNMLHLPITLWSRRGVQRLGGSYSRGLLEDQAESISVVIPCYNYGKYIGQAIRSALNQSRKPDEIIVINDGSTDDSLKQINKFRGKVTIIDQKNRGVIKTKNRGLNTAKGEWIIFLDADDYLHPDYIKTLYAASRRFRSDVIYSGMHFIGNGDGIFASRPFSARSLRHGNYINNSALMRRQRLLDLGGYKTKLDFGFEDWELYLALAEAGAAFRYVKKPLLYYRRHESSSRDTTAAKKLRHAHATVRELHPTLFSVHYRAKDWVHDLLTIRQRRTFTQILKDYRYVSIRKLDNASANRRWLNKLLGSARLVASGRIDQVPKKVALNIKRAAGRAGK